MRSTKIAAISMLTAAITLYLPLRFSKADVILTVDLSNTSAVVFTATDAVSAASFLNADNSIDGITLDGFFDGNLATRGSLATTGTINVLSTTNSTARAGLGTIFVDNFNPGGWTTNDLNIYDLNNSFTSTFRNTSPALTGTTTANLSPFSGFRSVGYVGNIFAGDPDDNRVIGQFAVVPEPSAFFLLAVGTAGFATCRRRKIR